MGLQCAFQPALTGHLSITASFLGPKGDHYRQVSLFKHPPPPPSTAALQSVFPQSELGTFMALNKPDKEKQLQELTAIVTGIRLFNRDCGKGGDGIDDCKSVGLNAKQVGIHMYSGTSE